MGQPNEELMRNKEGKTEASSLASCKVRKQPTTFPLFSHASNCLSA